MPFDSQLDLIDRSLQARKATLRTLKFHLLRAQNRIQAYANKGRTDRTYDVGDCVYVKLQPYKQLSLKSHTNHKLSSTFFGSFQIIAKVGVVAYTLALPATTKIHPTFHISQLKRKIGLQPAAVTLPVVHSSAGSILLYPEEVLDRRMIHKHGTAAHQVAEFSTRR